MAVCCSVLQCCYYVYEGMCAICPTHSPVFITTAHYITLATHCNTLQHTQHTATHATHCNTLHHIAAHCSTHKSPRIHNGNATTHCNTLQHTTTPAQSLIHKLTNTHTQTHTHHSRTLSSSSFSSCTRFFSARCLSSKKISYFFFIATLSYSNLSTSCVLQCVAVCCSVAVTYTRECVQSLYIYSYKTSHVWLS